jgi:hypothetical protein
VRRVRKCLLMNKLLDGRGFGAAAGMATGRLG